MSAWELPSRKNNPALSPPPGAEDLVNLHPHMPSNGSLNNRPAADISMPEEPLDLPPPAGEPIAPTRKMQIEWFDNAADAALAEPDNPLIEGLLDEGAMSVIYGDSNAGKTFVALDMAFHAATGLPWNGRHVKRGLVVYVAAEGGTRIKRRLAALKARYIEDHGQNASKPLFALIRYPIDLRSNDANLKEIVALIRQAEQDGAHPCLWIIVDTLSRAMAGGDENSPVDMGRIVTAADRIRAETKAHFSYVHHSGKDAARGARGHSLLRAATDTEIEVTPGALTATKQRDMEGGFSIGLRLIDRQIGIGHDGAPIKSAIVEWGAERGIARDNDTTSARLPKVPKQSRLLIDCIREAISTAGKDLRPWPAGPLVRAAPEETIRALYKARVGETVSSEGNRATAGARERQAWNRALKRLIDSKDVIQATQQGERWLWLP